jgi:hypothetical protein
MLAAAASRAASAALATLAALTPLPARFGRSEKCRAAEKKTVTRLSEIIRHQ